MAETAYWKGTVHLQQLYATRTVEKVAEDSYHDRAVSDKSYCRICWWPSSCLQVLPFFICTGIAALVQKSESLVDWPLLLLRV